MKKVTVTGKTVESAIEDALGRLHATRDQVKVSVLQQPSRGFLGLIGARAAEVKVERLFDPVETAVQFLEDILSKMNLEDVKVEIQQKTDPIILNFTGSRRLGILIGRRGQTLDSLQYLVNVVVNRKVNDYIRIVLDAEGYRSRRETALKGLADRIARQVIQTGKQTALEPMSPMERKLIHSQIQQYDQLSTFSEGKDPQRKVVITIKSQR